MLLKQLVDYAERLEREAGAERLPSGYQKVPIRWIIGLNKDGHFQGMLPTTDGSGSKRDRGRHFVAPHLMRSSGIRAKLLADNAEYVLGIGKSDAGAEKVRKRHEAFKKLVTDCAEITGLPEVLAIQRFLAELNPETIGRPENLDPAENVTFSVDGIMPMDLPEVREYWAKAALSAPHSRKKGNVLEAECLISGEYGPVMNREPVKIKGIPGGQSSGMNLISANESAYESYGLKASQIAPVKVEYAEKYANALNQLLQDEQTHLRLGPVVYVFWTREQPIPPVVEALREPDPGNPLLEKLFAGETVELRRSQRSDQVKETLKSPLKGRPFGEIPDDAFYVASLSASGSRAVVRDYVQTTVRDVGANLSAYFQAQRIVESNGQLGHPLGLYALAASLYREPKREMVASVPVTLLGLALKRAPLPFAFLRQLAARNRAERRVTRPRAALTKMTLSSLKEEMNGMEQLDRDRPEASYHLGRLMAVLEDIQKGALPKVKSTVVDRFYGSFSTTPSGVFGRLMQSTQAHLGKLRKNNPRAFTDSEKRLQEVMGHIHEIPNVLPLKDQGYFSLGYYHEKAHHWQEVMAKSAEKKARESQGE